MSHDPIQSRLNSGVLEISLNRPTEGNKITEEMGAQLVALLGNLSSECKLVLLRSNGEDFCTGRQSPQFDRSKATAVQFREIVAEGPLRLYRALRECRAPIVGVLQGKVHGVGCAIAALCDLAVAADDASFLIPEMDAGIPPTLVMSALAGRVPYHTLTDMVYLREELSAADARRFGIISRVVPRGKLQNEGARIASKMAASSAATLATIKEYAIAVCAPSSASSASLAAALISNVLASTDR
ncbi:MAG: enoyl-CoA hydratase/isomerase family protein [Hyphomicrobiaceae bacterium]|jgi:enoyl-CoA hydratase/carnithine racemase|nr:enoyl-CoA hydratase/isomerase family protein [Hyphomicrobiaceae bacterium]